MNRRPFTQNAIQRGFTAVEVSIFMVAATIVATVSSVALLTLSGDSAQAGSDSANRGIEHAVGAVQVRGPVIATRGDVDVDGNNVIELSGSDIQAVASLTIILTADLANGIDLTPPYTIDSTGIDPDFSTSQIATVVSVTTENVGISSAAWSVTFPGDDDGDNILEKGERAEITVWLLPEDLANGWFDLGSGVSDPYMDSSGEALIERGQLTVRITTDNAPDTSITRSMPIELTSSMLLE